MSRGPIERTRIVIYVYAQIQDNGDGTWTAAADVPRVASQTATGASREEALSLLASQLDVPEIKQ